MLGYIGHEEENRQTLQTHADGHVWLHTGDLGRMDSEGFVYFSQRVKAFVVLKDNCPQDEDMKQSILEHCKKHIAKYALPSEIEFRATLPTTLVGKVAYTVLEKEEELKAN